MATLQDDPDSETAGASEPYQVGYKRPPRQTQFQKGQSGNPQGRPKGRQNFKTDLAAELGERVRITEGGEAKLLTKQQALIKRTMEKAFKGEMRAIEVLIKWLGQYLDEEVLDEVPAPLSQEDQNILARARARWAESFRAQFEQEVSDAATNRPDDR